VYLVTSDTTLTYDGLTTLYRKRWNVEPYHKSLKQNASLERSPTHTVTTQTNHVFGAVCGYIKLELLKQQTKLTYFALKSKLYTQAVRVAFDALRQMNPERLADLMSLRDFYAGLERQHMPYALPRIRTVVQEAGMLITVEQRLAGTSLSTLLPGLTTSELAVCPMSNRSRAWPDLAFARP
jgi:hypothetical protein